MWIIFDKNLLNTDYIIRFRIVKKENGDFVILAETCNDESCSFSEKFETLEDALKVYNKLIKDLTINILNYFVKKSNLLARLKLSH